MHRAAIGLLLALSLLQTKAFAQTDPVKDSLAIELGFIKQVFQTGYAPREWKKAQFGWDLDTEYAKALTSVANKSTLTATDYRQIVSGLLSSTHDYHVGVHYYATEIARLPFLVNGTLGHYFIVYIDTSKLNSEVFPFQVGDEIITFAGRPVADVIHEIQLATHWGVDSTDARLAERLLTTRPASMAMTVPNGQVIVEAKRGDVVIKRELAWDYTPETVVWNTSNLPLKTMSQAATSSSILKNPQMAWGNFETWNQSVDVTPSKFQIGGRKSWVPILGQVIWQSADTDIFDAYIYRNEQGKLIGYVRIPMYDGQDGKAFAEFKKLMGKYQTSTDALIIDEVNNPGGSVFYVLALMSVLSADPIKVPDHAMTLWPQMISDNLDLMDKLSRVKTDEETRKAFGADQMDGFPITYNFGKAALEFTREVQDQWKAGKRLTSPLFLYGVDKVNPDPQVNYSKPIVVLTNELDFSGGDFFPAILQDNKRAKIFGQRTAGAGGYVLQVGFPSSLGLKGFSFTGSIARRVNNDPIENLGVTPDVLYSYTIRDLQSGFVDYKAALNAAVAAEIAAH